MQPSAWRAVLVACLIAGGCAQPTLISQQPTVAERTVVHDQLREMPPPDEPLTVAVYRYEDQTGQFEFSDRVQTLSRAVTQGASAILIKALQDASNGQWFRVVERENLENVLRERQIIRETRAIYQPDQNGALPPLIFAGMLIEGGIIGFDTNTATGGFGARILGIGGSAEYRIDTVNVYLRVISTSTGEILLSVNVSKTIFSVGVGADVFRFVSSDEILEIEAGVTQNEPEFLATKQAIEKGVIALILEGVDRRLFSFAEDTPESRALIEAYRREQREAVTVDALLTEPAGEPDEAQAAQVSERHERWER